MSNEDYTPSVEAMRSTWIAKRLAYIERRDTQTGYSGPRIHTGLDISTIE